MEISSPRPGLSGWTFAGRALSERRALVESSGRGPSSSRIHRVGQTGEVHDVFRAVAVVRRGPVALNYGAHHTGIHIHQLQSGKDGPAVRLTRGTLNSLPLFHA